jgi:hypothetical protein
MNILKEWARPFRYAARRVCRAAAKADIHDMVEHSRMLPILVRYGVGCEWEFAEYSIFRVLELARAGVRKPPTRRNGST